MKRGWKMACAILVLILAMLACNRPDAPAPDPTVYVPPVDLPPTDAPPTPGAPVGDETPGHLPPGSVALYYATDSWDDPRRLFALAADGTSVDLGIEFGGQAEASRSGRWLATFSNWDDDELFTLRNLESGVEYVLTSRAGFHFYGAAFDAAETRLAFLELGGPIAEGTPWAIGVVRLSDGATTRFESSGAWEDSMLPGYPVGWSAAGDELLLSQFVPYSEGGYAGVVALTLPPDAPAATIEALPHRTLVEPWSYTSRLWFSGDASRLLYLARDPEYVPAGYEVYAYDLAVNQLWSVEVASGAREMLWEVTDGQALAPAADWAPDGNGALLIEGWYGDTNWDRVALRARDAGGGMREVGPLPLLPNGSPMNLTWCAPRLALYDVYGQGEDSFVHQLYRVDPVDGTTSLIISSNVVAIVGCVR